MSVKRVAGGTLIAGIRNVVRFNKTNNQLYGDFYRKVVKGYWGFAGFDLSPDARFLPRYSLRGGIFRSLSSLEAGLSFSFMRFPRSEVYLLIPSAVFYLPADLFYSANLYISVKRGTFTLLNRLYREKGPLKWYLSLSAGTSSERLQAGEDFFRYRTLSFGGGAEYDIVKNFSLGVEGKYEIREGLYRRYGGEVYGIYRW